MTALCLGGTSSPKDGALASVIYTSGLLAEILVRYEAAWLIPVIPLLGLAPFSLTTFCSTDPPAIPSFTLAETDALLNLSFGTDFASGIAKVRDLAAHMIWRELCQCDVGLPSTYSPPAIPAGTPITQVVTAPNTPCGTYTGFGPSNRQQFASSGSLHSGVSDPLPVPGITSATVTFHTSVNTNGGLAAPLILSWRNVSNAVVGVSTSFTLPITGTTVITLAVPPTASYLFMDYSPVGGATRIEWIDWVINYFCGNTLGTGGDCCTDSTVIAQLDSILTLVTLIQRQAVPFAYVDGAAHTLLSGNGELTLAGVLGARVDITTLPGRAGRADGDPVTLFDLGWIAWGDTTGFRDREFIRRETQLSLPAAPGVFTRIGYTLAPDVVATITEILREP